MSDAYRDLMREYAAETGPTDSELRELHTRLRSQVIDAESSSALLRTLPAVTRSEVDDLKRQVRLGRREKPRNRGWVWLGAGAAGSLALAAMALLVLGGAVLTGLYLSFSPDSPGVVGSGAQVVDAELPTTDEPRLNTPVPGVALRYAGTGAVGGTEAAPVVEWSTGEVEVSVEPGAGIALTVETREATVRVIGTVFSVDRDALGTAVSVTRGEVAVDCKAGGSHRLTADQQVTCIPLSAAGLLGRAVALEERGAPPDAVLDAVDVGLASDPSAVLERELRSTRLRALVAMSRPDEALSEVERLLEGSGARRNELLIAGATLALNQRDCVRAAPWVAELKKARALPKALAKRARACRE